MFTLSFTYTCANSASTSFIIKSVSMKYRIILYVYIDRVMIKSI